MPAVRPRSCGPGPDPASAQDPPPAVGQANAAAISACGTTAQNGWRRSGTLGGCDGGPPARPEGRTPKEHNGSEADFLYNNEQIIQVQVTSHAPCGRRMNTVANRSVSNGVCSFERQVDPAALRYRARRAASYEVSRS